MPSIKDFWLNFPIIIISYHTTFLWKTLNELLHISQHDADRSHSRQGWFRVLKVISLSLVVIALIAEVLPEVKAKLIVVPALIVVLIIGIVEVRRR